MSFGVFIHRPDSIYDDRPDEQYQFPRPYLARAKMCIGGWIVYYEPVKLPRSRGYYAIAEVEKIVPDPVVPHMYLAIIRAGSYLDFSHPVPFSGAGGVVERGILNEHGQISGRAQAAVRPLNRADFERIVSIGLGEDRPLLPRVSGFSDQQAPFGGDVERDRISRLSSRIIRDPVFRSVILQAYDERCAVSGLKLINGGGRAEVAAAHIQPVSANGPDIVNNGIALSGTAHWMFDRGLISLADDLQILVSRQANDTEGIRAFINSSGYAYPPFHILDRPYPRFLQWHRENCFKQ